MLDRRRHRSKTVKLWRWAASTPGNAFTRSVSWAKASCGRIPSSQKDTAVDTPHITPSGIHKYAPVDVLITSEIDDSELLAPNKMIQRSRQTKGSIPRQTPNKMKCLMRSHPFFLKIVRARMATKKIAD
jgi:hypothetical protein